MTLTFSTHTLMFKYFLMMQYMALISIITLKYMEYYSVFADLRADPDSGIRFQNLFIP